MSAPTPQEVAASLTPAQRRWVMYNVQPARGYWPTRNALVRKGLIGRHGERSELCRDVCALLWRPASCDTHPGRGGDEAQISAPFMGGAVPAEEQADAQPLASGDS